MSAVQLITPVEGSFLQLTPEKKLRFTNGAWRIHTNNVPVGEQSPAPAIPPTVSETPPTLPSVNPFWQKTSTGEFFYQYDDGETVSWKEVGGGEEPLLPILSETEPSLPNANTFWQKTSTGDLYFQYTDGTTPSWRKVTRFSNYDVTITSGPSVDADLAQVTVVDNSTADVKTIAFTNMPEGRAKTMVVLVVGKVGTIAYPGNANLADDSAIALSNTKTTLVFFWTGSDFIVSKGPSY